MRNKLSSLFVTVKSVLALIASLFIKRDCKWIAVGSWCGNLYTDNSKHLVEYMLMNGYLEKGYKIVWVGNEQVCKRLPPGVVFAQLNALSSIPLLLKCKFMFFTQSPVSDISSMNVLHGAILVNLDHGLGVKKWDMDAIDYHGQLEVKNMPIMRRIKYAINGYDCKYDFFTIASRLQKGMYITSNAYRIKDSTAFIKAGTPRNDILVNASETQIETIRRKYSKIIGFNTDSRIVLYLPTYRRKKEQIRTLVCGEEREREKLNSILDRYNAVLIEKNHYVANKYVCNNRETDDKRLIKLNIEVDLQELLLLTDAQISDYSGSFIDYLLLDRPIIHYAYDYYEYRDFDSGLYLDIDEFASGPVAYSFDELCQHLEDVLSGKDDYAEIRKQRRELLVEYEIGKASETICREVLGNV